MNNEMKTVADAFFDYLKDILYNPSQAKLDIESLPQEFQDLGRGMEYLEKCIAEMRSFETSLAKGDLSVIPPTVDNILAGPIKELQGSLRHLAWQTECVAKGDYNQRVDFMGDFSDAFNTMIQQLQDRKVALEGKNKELSDNLELVMTLTDYTQHMFAVVAIEDNSVLFLNHAAKTFLKEKSKITSELLQQYNKKNAQAKSFPVDTNYEIIYEHDGLKNKAYYSSVSNKIVWQGIDALVHIITDETEQKRKEDIMYSLAYTDPLTGLKNRRYAMDLIEEWKKEGIFFILSIVDVDYLKYCNDTFGHTAGDRYLIDIAKGLKPLCDEVCRVGGDEFILLTKDSSVDIQNEKLAQLRSYFKDNSENGEIIKSFSYGTIDSREHPADSSKILVQKADTIMYDYKQNHRAALDVLKYTDDRYKEK